MTFPRAPPETTPAPPSDLYRRMREHCLDLQQRIASAYERADGAARMTWTDWTRPAGGGGRMGVLRGDRMEKAGANVSAIEGEANPLTGRAFRVAGLSTIAHPANPHAPTAHMNVRYFEEPGVPSRYWFGGGMDLTPMGFPYAEDAERFHAACRAACAASEPGFHDFAAKWADEYFFVRHRGRARGVGGIFFDYRASDPERDFDLVRRVGDAFLDAYVPILERRKDQPHSVEEREAQLRARGVYVEFNLLYDRGTRFGFESGGNVEAILVSLPPLVRW